MQDEEFEHIVKQSLDELPEEFATQLDNVEIVIEPWPLDQYGRPHARLLGLYHGRPRTQRSVEDSGRLPDVIYIFQEDIELVSRSEPDLIAQVRTTVLHEIGHHFGMDEDDLDDVGYG